MHRVTRIGIIGDVHGEDKALETVLTFLQAQTGLDALLCTGDLPGKQGIGDTNRCCELLQQYNVLTIRGNHDRWFIENEGVREMLGMVDDLVSLANRTYIAALSRTRTFETPIGPLLLCHGLGDDDMSGVYPGDSTRALESNSRLQALVGEEQYKFIVNGHTHQRMVRDIYGLTIINAGTLLWDKEPGFAIADFENGTVQFYNLTPFTNEITEAELSITLYGQTSVSAPPNTQHPTSTPGVSHAKSPDDTP